ncbi:MAG: GNAT family N-acetyltransferase [Hyphomicrobiaceae bacterium]|nr:GNAT family N-acetyltransferase [Hyphomicrobiaceae bacterium]
MPGALTFLPVEARHLPIIARWMEEEHWRAWWGDPATELGYIRDMVEGRDTSRPFLFAVDGEPVGYIQYWFVGDHQSEAWIASNPWLALVPSDTLGIDMSIGRPEWLGRGVGSQVLRAFADELWAAGHRNLIIDPDPANARAIAAYRKAGFEPVRHLVGKTGDCVILSYGKIGSRTSGTLASGSGPIDGTST